MDIIAYIAAIFIIVVFMIQLSPFVEIMLSRTINGHVLQMLLTIAYFILLINMFHVYCMIAILPLCTWWLFKDYKRLISKIKETKQQKANIVAQGDTDVQDDSSGEHETDG